MSKSEQVSIIERILSLLRRLLSLIIGDDEGTGAYGEGVYGDGPYGGKK